MNIYIYCFSFSPRVSILSRNDCFLKWSWWNGCCLDHLFDVKLVVRLRAAKNPIIMHLNSSFIFSVYLFITLSAIHFCFPPQTWIHLAGTFIKSKVKQNTIQLRLNAKIKLSRWALRVLLKGPAAAFWPSRDLNLELFKLWTNWIQDSWIYKSTMMMRNYMRIGDDGHAYYFAF